LHIATALEIHRAPDALVEEVQEERQELIGIVLMEVLKVSIILRTRSLETCEELVRIDHPSVVIRPHLSLKGEPFLHQTVFQVHTLRLKDLIPRMETQEMTHTLQCRVHVAGVPQIR
jgi:hypothetical protein